MMWRRLLKRLAMCGVICAMPIGPMSAWANFTINTCGPVATSNWDGTSNGSAHFVAVNANDGEYVYESGQATDIYNLTNHAAGPETGVRILTQAWSQSGVGTFWVSISKGGTFLTEEFWGTDWTEDAYYSYWYTGTWTTTQVNDAQVKARANGYGANLCVDLHSVMFLTC